MSDVSDVYNAIIAKMETLFPNKQRIPNPYSLKDNPDRCLKDSWGVAAQSNTPNEGEFCNVYLARGFDIIFTREMFALDSKSDGFDFSVSKLLDDAHTVQVEFYKLDELGIESTVDQLEIDGSSGINSVFTDKKKFLKIEVSVTVATSDSLK